MPSSEAHTRPFHPDALTDSTLRRRVKVERRLGGGCGLIPRLLVATEHAPLSLIVLRLGHDYPLYSPATAKHARDVAKTISGSSPAWNALQRGVNGSVHVNIIMRSDHVPPRLPRHTYVAPVHDVVGLFSYLSGPADARASRQTHPITGLKSMPTPEQLAAASADYIRARSQGRLPRLQWTSHLPRMHANDLRVSSLEGASALPPVLPQHFPHTALPETVTVGGLSGAQDAAPARMNTQTTCQTGQIHADLERDSDTGRRLLGSLGERAGRERRSADLFLILAFRELRRLELDAVLELEKGRTVLNVEFRLRVNVGQFYGIEYDEFPSQIARVAMWLTEHQMNLEASRSLGKNFNNLPLRTAAHIRHGDALETDWATHLELPADADGLSRVYLVGNPPFVGGKKMSEAQRAQVTAAFDNARDAGVLDYVSTWYLKAAQLMAHIADTWPHIQCATALVSTNSVTQGEQVAPLWTPILNTHAQVITVAHQTFKWTNDAPGQAAVHCVIVGFRPAKQAKGPFSLYTYASPTSPALQHTVNSINAYLTEGPPTIVRKAQQPLRAGVPPIHFGNMPLDGGNLLLTSEERDKLLADEPGAAPYIRPLLDAQDFLNGATRYCLWLDGAAPADLAKLPHVRAKIDATRQWRLASTRAQTRRKADTPMLFGENRHPLSGQYLAVPNVSSERREYVPVGYLDSETIVNNLLFMVPDADLFHFGVIQSRLHMDWMRLVSGRMKSDYRYSKDLSYNTFPWPERSALKPAQLRAVETAAQDVLTARGKYPTSTLAQLYDPLLMPAELRTAHNALDRAVEALYGLKSGGTAAQRISTLLRLYGDLTAPLLPTSPPAPTRRTRRTT